jgi:hypothetical protein
MGWGLRMEDGGQDMVQMRAVRERDEFVGVVL